jgi:hypothetical protein
MDTPANSDINDRVWKRHGRWKSDSSKDGYVVDSVDKRLKVSKNLAPDLIECRPSFNPLETNLNLETILSLAAV